MNDTSNFIKVMYDPAIDITGKVLHSSGTLKSGDLPLQHYARNAFIPAYDLTDISSNEQLVSDQINNFDTGHSICLVKFPGQLIDLAERLEIHNVESASDFEVYRAKNADTFEAFDTAVTEFLKAYSNDDEKITPHKVYFGYRRQLTSSINYQKRPPVRVGLHVDIWDNLSLDQLDNARNRICINLGKGHRYFVFINLTMRQLIEQYLADEDLTDMPSPEIVRLFLEKYPSYPVTFIKLDPFEGYIAPTENIIHDGSNFDSDEVDIQMTSRGYFVPKSVVA
ncbi:hypothetical protein [Chitinophaga filiformis]|uniref:Uncharacterized protein n=1 Tax=Chitinophaga filiformis TaxID=104663 RepID=A0ABY4I7W1_CHIFI|nr:hypothetical protein [Chitinophaga filiformis]UPK71670.1 hypothetical protein MYF79_10295 [Chitinophaga filiformis]